jgi:uncharacterized membrane protein YhaH (DUF805 family)
MSDQNSSALAAMAAAYGLVVSLVALGFVVLTLVVNWRVASKAGYSGVLSLLMLVPFVNFIILLIFAFAKWPIERQLEQYARYAPPPAAPAGPPYATPGTTIVP